MGTFIGITGRRFGNLVVLHRAENRGKQTFWACKCDCGGYIETRGGDIKNGSVKSCGCLRRSSARGNTYIDIEGQTFNRLTTIEYVASKDGRALWLFRCKCGNFLVAPGKDVRSGNTKSCGCLKEENSGFKPGILHPYYNPDLSDEERSKKRLIPEYIRWIKAVYKRFDYTCQKCGRRGNGIVIHAHHIESYASNPELRTDIRNGIVLCSYCHYSFHGRYGRNTNAAQLNQFLSKEECTDER